MILKPFTDPGGNLDYDAACEQWMLQEALYAQRKDTFYEIARLGNLETTELLTFLSRKQDLIGQDDYTPSFSLFRQQDQYWLPVEGTWTAQQWTFHLTGIFVVDFPTGENGLANRFFWTVSKTIYDKIKPLIAADMNEKTINLSGHSLGGGCALLIAIMIKKDFPQAKCNVIGFGSPKSLTAEYDGVLPDTYHRIHVGRDAIGTLPRRQLGWSWHSSNPWSNQFLLNPDWRHFGESHWLSKSGKDLGRWNFDYPPNGVSRDTSSLGFDHDTTSYREALFANWAIRKGSYDTGGMIDFYASKLKSGSKPNPTGNPRQWRYIDYAELNQKLFPNQGIVLTDDNYADYWLVGMDVNNENFEEIDNIQSIGDDMASASGYWKLSLRLDNDLQSHTSSVVVAGNKTLLQARDIGFSIANGRAGCLGSNQTSAQLYTTFDPPTRSSPHYTKLKVSDALNPFYSQLFDVPPLDGRPFSGGGEGNTAADPLHSALSVRIKGTSGQTPAQYSWYTLTLQGIPDAVISNCVYDGSVTVDNSPATTFHAELVELLNRLCDPANSIGFLGLDKSVTKKLSANLAVHETGNVEVTYTAHGLVTGDVVRVTGAGRKGVNGDQSVAVIDANSFYLIDTPITTATLPSKLKFVKIRGVDGTKNFVFYQFTSPEGGWADVIPKITSRRPARRISDLSFSRRDR